jgi:hypothetical protein
MLCECGSGGKEGAKHAESILPTLEYIKKVFSDVQATISKWCQPAGWAPVTVLRNLAIASWYKVGAV